MGSSKSYLQRLTPLGLPNNNLQKQTYKDFTCFGGLGGGDPKKSFKIITYNCFTCLWGDPKSFQNHITYKDFTPLWVWPNKLSILHFFSCLCGNNPKLDMYVPHSFHQWEKQCTFIGPFTDENSSHIRFLNPKVTENFPSTNLSI